MADDEAPAFAAGLDQPAVPLDQIPGHLIRRLQQVAVSLFFDQIEKAGFDLTPVQYAALLAVRTYPNIDQASLAGVIAHDRATIGGVIDRLEGKGLLRRVLFARDRRLRQLVLEPAGDELLKAVAPAIQATQADILDPLSQEEQTIFLLLLSKLVAANNERSRAPMRPVSRRRRETC